MPPSPAARALIERLDLAPHPEGGFFREVHRSAHCTSIAFLLLAGAPSRFHRVDAADEVWHHHAGGTLALHVLTAGGAARHRIGPDGPWQAVVPPGAWQAAEVVEGDYVLVGCTVAPPFSFDRFALADRARLIADFPAHRALIERLT